MKISCNTWVYCKEGKNPELLGFFDTLKELGVDGIDIAEDEIR